MRMATLMIAAVALLTAHCAAGPQQANQNHGDNPELKTFSISKEEVEAMKGAGEIHHGDGDHVGSGVQAGHDTGYLTDTRGNDQFLFACDYSYNGNTANAHGENIPYRTYDVFDKPGGDCTAIDTNVNLETHWICTGGGNCSGKSKHPG